MPEFDRREHTAKMHKARAAKYLELRSLPPPELPDGADWRPIRGFPGFYVDRDKSVWSHICSGGWPCPWRRVAVVMKGRSEKTPSACLRAADGRVSLVSVARLAREAFLRPDLPAGSSRGSGKDDDGADNSPIEVRAVVQSPRPAPPPEPAPAVARYRPVPPVARLASRPTSPHPGGPLGLGPMARGSGHGRSKLSETDVEQLRALRASGWSYPRLAREFRISRSNVWYILTGNTWGHVPFQKGGEGC